MENVPIEILVRIFQYLPDKDLITCSLICSQWYQVIRVHISKFHLIPFQKQILDNSYYFGELTNSEAAKLLYNCPIGTFLLHNLGSLKYERKELLTLSCVYFNHRIMHLPIIYGEKKRLHPHFEHYHLIPSVQHYRESHDGQCWLGCILKKPILRKNCFTLKELAKAAFCDSTIFSQVINLKISDELKQYLISCTTKQKNACSSFFCGFVMPNGK